MAATFPPPSAESADGDTRSRILRVAIHHFAAYGFEGTRLRRLLREANINLALAHYHFGSKQALYEASLRHYLAAVLDARRVALQQWRKQAGSTQERLVACFTAYVLPHMRVAVGPGGNDYARLIQRALHEPQAIDEAVFRDSLELRQEYVDELRTLLPAASPDLLTSAMDALVAVMLSESIRQTTVLPGQAGKSQPGNSCEELTAFVARLIAGGLQPLIAC